MGSIKRLEVNEHQEETLEQRYPGVLYHIFEERPALYLNGHIPWHWHTFFEFSYVEEGQIEYHWPEGMVTLSPGQAVFINSNILHKIQPAAGQNDCRLRDILFDQHFLSGTYNSTLEQKYFSPIVQCEGLQVYPILPDSAAQIRMIAELLQTIDCGGIQDAGIEFRVQQHLANLWMLLFEHTAAMRQDGSARNDVSMQRLKQMITFIRAHYPENITLKDIAAAASIGERECLRCFRRNLSTTPVAYLNQHRVYMAAQDLLQTTKTVLTVSEENGFSSNSYFTKVFRKIMHCTPKEFQQRNRYAASPQDTNKA